ncbi:MAG: hypothetical protein A2746_01390 [Candidatus Yanofskybacteria bacterium RIFCSPHIGHO2_01_FULL_44_22]|uniref:Uncharacterized protein n=1 Tax=Candidatus Yanofskybacteria bacterium RIFCSPHIGHO2_01_FULL_44_22 TaxID=1802669 RepID=A0A1F8EXC1_9BACT|nr:MAG: hypothetical protein A2746_01390 [Candidatus Yanofskybacteria bacterium RIFCSPHIGHO2_01_FULL_44_22]
MKNIKIFILFFAVFILDTVVMPALFNFKENIAVFLLISAWLAANAGSTGILAGVFMSFGAEILSGANPGVFVLSFLAAALIFFIAVKFIILGQDGIFSHSARVYFQKLIVTIGIFIVFALLSILINNLLYAANGYFLLISAMAVNAKMIVYIIVWSAIFTVLLNRKKPNAESRFLNSLF